MQTAKSLHLRKVDQKVIASTSLGMDTSFIEIDPEEERKERINKNINVEQF